MPPKSPQPLLQCSFCDSSFRRSEHLARHVLSHTGEKPHSCPVCGRAFTRKDSLARHLPVHQDQEGVYRFAPGNRTSRACSNCARVRLKCDGLIPCCSRCRSKKQSCTYPQSRHRIRTVEETGDSASVTSQVSGPSPSTIVALTDDQTLPSQRQQNQPASGPANPWHSASDVTTGLAAVEEQRSPGSDVSMDSHQGLLDSGPMVLAQELTQGHEDDDNARLRLQDSDHTLGVIDANFSTAPSLSNPFQTLVFQNPAPPDLDLQAILPGAVEQFVPWDDEFNLLDCTSFVFSDEPHGGELSQIFPGRPGNLEQNIYYRGHPQFPLPLGGPTPQSQDENGDASHHGHHAPFNRPVAETDKTFNDEPTHSQHSQQGRPRQNSSSDGSWPTPWDPTETDGIVLFPDMSSASEDIIEAESYGHVGSVGHAIHSRISQCVNRSAPDTSHYRGIQNPQVPPLAVFDCFVQLYFEHFHPDFPILHKPTFDPSKAPWQLVLATGAIGCLYSKIPQARQCATALNELLVRSLLDTTALDNSTVRQLWFAQAVILKAFGKTYSGEPRLLEMAEVSRNNSHTLCRRKGLFKRQPKPCLDLSALDIPNRAKHWEQWVAEESLRRAGFGSFVADAQIGLYYNHTLCVAIEELQQPLPCHELLWEAPTAQRWSELFDHVHGKQKQSKSTLESFFANVSRKEHRGQKEVKEHGDNDLGGFCRHILGLAVYYHSLSLSRAISSPLQLLPSVPVVPVEASLRQIRSKALATITGLMRELPFQPSAAAPDCHLLLEAMLLCIPRSALLHHAHHCLNPASSESAESRQQVQAWMEQDGGSTARSAVSFAGRLLGVLREHKSVAPYEPMATALCVITLWTYSRATLENSDGHGQERRRGVLRLDGFNDFNDKVSVSDWISGKSKKGAHLRDVGDISRPGAPSRILSVAIEHMRELKDCCLARELAIWLKRVQDRTAAMPSS